MEQELEKEFNKITTGRDRMCDEFTREDVKSFIKEHFIARSEVEKMIEEIRELVKNQIVEYPVRTDVYLKHIIESLSTPKKRI